MTQDVHYVTKEGLEQLKKELEYYEKTKRIEVANRIQKAKEYGDLSENAEYSEAKEEQSFVEGKVVELRDLIQNAAVIKQSHDGTVRVGSSIRVVCDGKEKDFEIVGSREANPAEGRISNESPMGSAFIGRKVNEQVEIEAPRGTLTCTVLEIK